MDKARYTADAYFFVISRPATSAVRNAIRRRRKWDVYDSRDTSNMVRDLPQEIARRLVLTHFGPEIVKSFLGIQPIGCYELPLDYFAAFLDSSRLFNHSYKLVGRRSHLAEVQKFLRSKMRAAILRGRGGMGKSRILLEMCRRLESARPAIQTYVVAPNVRLTAELVSELPYEPCVLVVEDAHRRQDIDILLGLWRARQHQVKIIFSTRPQGVEQLRSALAREGLGTADLIELPEVKELTVSDARELAAYALGRRHIGLARILASITRDCPLVTVVAGGLIRSGRLDPRAYQTAPEFKHEVLSRFEDEMLGKVVFSGDAADIKKCLELISAVGPVFDNDLRLLGAMSTFLQTPRDALIRVIESLEKAGVLLRRGHALAITPDVLSDHILHEACITTRGGPTGYADRVFAELRQVALRELLRNTGELDWLTRGGTGLLDSVWQSIRSDFESASHFARCGLLDDISAAAQYLPQQMIGLVEYAMGHPSTVPDRSPVAKLVRYRYTNADVLERLPGLLQSASRTIDYIPRCCDLLWEFVRSGPSASGKAPGNAAGVLRDMAQYANHKPVKVHELMLDAAAGWLRKQEAHTHLFSPLDVVDPVFVKETHSSYFEDGAFVSGPLVIRKDTTQGLRDRARSIVRRCLMSRELRETLRALHSLEEALKPPSGYFGRKIRPAEIRQWVPEDLKTIALIEELARANSQPVVRMQIADALRVHTHRSAKPVAEAAKRVISIIPLTYEMKLTRLVAYRYGLDSWAEEDIHRLGELHQEQVAALNAEVAAEFIKRNRAPARGVQVLERLIGKLSQAGVSTNGAGVLLGTIAATDSRYALRMAGVIIRRKSSVLRSWFHSILHGVSEGDDTRATDMAARAIATSDESLCHSLAVWYRVVLYHRAPSRRDIKLLRRLLHSTRITVRRAAIGCLGSMGKTAPSIAAELATGVRVGSDASLAEELAGAFSDGVGVSLSALTDRQLGLILCKLEAVAKLGGHATERFLTRVAERSPTELVRMLLIRLARAARRPSRNYDPVPDVDLTRCLHAIIGTKAEESLLRRTLKQYVTSKYPARRWLGEFFAGLSMNFTTAASLQVLGEYVNSGARARIEAISGLLRTAPHSFVESQVDFVDGLLRAAHQAGSECCRRVVSELHASAISFTRQSKVGEPSPQDVGMRDECLAIAKRFPAGSPSRHFYEDLAKHAQSSIDEQLARDAVTLA